MENLDSGFTIVPHKILNVLLLLDLKARDWKVILLIIRLTYGCNKRWAVLKNYDLKTINIAPSHAKEVLTRLLDNKLIIKNEKTKEYRLNEEYITSKVPELVKSNFDKLNYLIGKQLSKLNYQNGNKNVTNSGITALPNEEVSSTQNGNENDLPNKEFLALKQAEFYSPKDILKTLNTDKKSIADISIKKDLSRFKKDPNFFTPQTEIQSAAYEAWHTLEPFNPNSFPFYLWAAAQGIPATIFYEFTSEIKHDSSIGNKGKVFNKKITEYLKRQEATEL